MDTQEQRRLLELAAKAASVDFYMPEGMNTPWCGGGFYLRGCVVWNPLTDDGDAFRLACDLGLRVLTVARTESGAACSAVGDVTGERLSEIADMLSTRTATRLAIVRAAALIGEKMGGKP